MTRLADSSQRYGLIAGALQEIHARAAHVLRAASGASESTWSDTIWKDERLLRGVKFPLALMIEAALASRDEELLVIASRWQDELADHYRRSGFNYFEARYLPNDLDTASQVVRALRRHTPTAIDDLLAVAERHCFPRQLVPTWLDEPDPGRWFSGDSAVHADVQVNFLRTLAGAGVEVPYSLVVHLLETHGLRNYYYFPALYTAWQYSMLLAENPALVDDRTLRPLVDFVREWDRHDLDSPDWASCCRVAPVRTLLRQQPPTFLDSLFRQGIEVFLGTIRREPLDASAWLALAARDQWSDAKVYWSIKFSSFGNPTVVAALSLLCAEQCGTLLAALYTESGPNRPARLRSDGSDE